MNFSFFLIFMFSIISDFRGFVDSTYSITFQSDKRIGIGINPLTVTSRNEASPILRPNPRFSFSKTCIQPISKPKTDKNHFPDFSTTTRNFQTINPFTNIFPKHPNQNPIYIIHRPKWFVNMFVECFSTILKTS